MIEVGIWEKWIFESFLAFAGKILVKSGQFPRLQMPKIDNTENFFV